MKLGVWPLQDRVKFLPLCLESPRLRGLFSGLDRAILALCTLRLLVVSAFNAKTPLDQRCIWSASSCCMASCVASIAAEGHRLRNAAHNRLDRLHAATVIQKHASSLDDICAGAVIAGKRFCRCNGYADGGRLSTCGQPLQKGRDFLTAPPAWCG